MKCPKLRLFYKLQQTGKCVPGSTEVNYTLEYEAEPTLQYESRDDLGIITWVDVEVVFEGKEKNTDVNTIECESEFKMKTLEQIQEQIKFQESEYDRIDNLIKSDMSNLRRQMYLEVMGRHSARREALLWVIGKDDLCEQKG